MIQAHVKARLSLEVVLVSRLLTGLLQKRICVEDPVEGFFGSSHSVCCNWRKGMAGTTGFEPAASAVTVQNPRVTT